MTAKPYRVIEGTLYVSTHERPPKLHADRLNVSKSIEVYPANNWARRLSRLLFKAERLRAVLRHI